MHQLPTGPDQRARVEAFQRRHRVALLTMLFTDIVGSTAIKQKLGDTGAVMLIQQHHAALRALLAQFPEGEEIETAGDSFFLVFTKPSDAVRFALLWQHRLRTLAHETGKPLLDRIGIHVGEVFVDEQGPDHKPKDFYGLQVDTCARVMSLGEGDQILLTRTAFDSARQILRGEELSGLGPLEWLNHGPYLMKGVEDPVEVCEAGEGGVAVLKAPGDSEKARRPVTAGSEPVLGWRPGLGVTVPHTQWRLEEKLGEGGVGEVWLARHLALKDRRVFKFCFRADLARTLRREVALFKVLKERAAVSLHMVTLHDVFFDEPPFYLVTEFAAGRDLVDWCSRHGGVEKIPLETRLEIVAQIADALQAAQDAGIVHRDVKPSNILLAAEALPKNPTDVRALLGDFGIGQMLNPDLAGGVTRAGLTLTVQGAAGSGSGTPIYMAPEVVAGKPADARSDLYSLGVVLFQLLTGDLTRPVTTDWQESLADPLLAADLRRCFAGDPKQRFAGAGELARQLRALPERRARRAAEEAAQHARERDAQRRGMLRIGALAGALVVVFATLAGWAWLQTKSARRESAGRLDEWRRAERESTNRLAQWERAEAGETQSRRLLYASDMNLAQQTLKQNNLGRARRLLDRHRPKLGEEDLRGWEWRYLWQLTRSSALVTLTNRPVRGSSVSFSPDGSRLAVGWWDGRVDLWDVPGRKLVRTLTDHEYPHQGQVVFSPFRNLLAATSEPKVVALYDLDSGRDSILWRAPDQGEWDVRDLAFSQDGSRVVIYAGSTRELGDAVWVVNAFSSKVESRHQTTRGGSPFHGAARLSSDNRRLYLTRSGNNRYSIQCLDLATGEELWQTESQRDWGITKLAISPDGRLLASGSAFEDPAVRVWDAATGRLLERLNGHSSYVSKLAFTRDGRRLISAAADQSIRFWDTTTWTETQVLRGHIDEVHTVAISDSAQLVASAGKDGNLMLWKADGKSATDGYSRLSADLGENQVLPLDQSRVLLLPTGKPPELVNLKSGAPPKSLPEVGTSTNVLGWFGTNILCQWNRTNQIVVRELRGAEFIQRGALSLDSGTRPDGLAYNATRQLLAWSERALSNSVYLASLTAPERRIELKGDVPGFVPFLFSEDGNYLAARKGQDSLRVWNLETRQIVASINESFNDAAFAAEGRVLVVDITKRDGHEIAFFDLTHSDKVPRRVPGKDNAPALAVSPDGALVAASTWGGPVRLFDAAKAEWIEDLDGHMNASQGVAFSPDGRRLISSYGGQDAVKLWDVGTRQELLNLAGTGSSLYEARWSADGDVILAGAPWQVWRAPSWEEIAAAEAKEKTETKRP